MSEFNMDKMIQVKNLCKFPVYFKRINRQGEVAIPANTSIRITRDEIVSQVQNGNKLFTGIDGIGSHPRVYIDDAETRVYVGFETEDKPQLIVTDDKLKTVFAIKSKTSFEKAIKELIETGAEAEVLVAGAKKFSLNEYDKIKIIENYTGMKVD